MKLHNAVFQLTRYSILALCLPASFAVNTSPISYIRPPHIIEKSDSIAAQDVILQFLHWYKVNLNEANSFPILRKDSDNNYMLNMEAVTDYLNFIESSKCTSAKYRVLWQKFFDDKAILLKQEKLQSDMPEDFDLDFVLISQEPDEILNQLSNTKFKVLSENKSEALINVFYPQKELMNYEFEVSKTHGKWQIDYISTSNFD